MPELPDIALYIERLDQRVHGRTLQRIRVFSPFFVRTFDPPLSEAEGRKVTELRRVGKRIAIGVERGLWLIIHLMVAGRLQWLAETVESKSKNKNQLAAFDFENGTLLVTEAGTKKRASLHLLEGEESLKAHDPGGVEPLECVARFK